MNKKEAKKKKVYNEGLDPDRNKCPEQNCNFVPKKADNCSATWEECTKCGRIKKLEHRV